MNTIRNSALSGALLLGLASVVGAQVASSPSATDFKGRLNRAAFTQNKGQWNSEALFSGSANGMDLWISKKGFVFQYNRTKSDKTNEYAGHTVGMLFEGAEKFSAVGVKTTGVRQYLSGDKKAPITTTNFEKVRLNGIYQGVDAIAYFENKTPRYDFIVKPGASPKSINLNFKGASSLKVVDDHRLEIGTVLGSKYQQGLFAYQMVGSKQVAVPVKFKKIDDTHIGFEVGAYDKTKSLVIDPLVYGTYYGGDRGWDEVRGVAADSLGSVYITGYTRSSIYPVLYGPFGFSTPVGRDAFVSRLQGDAYNHDYSILVAGSGDEQGNFIQLDPLGNIWVVGQTNSTNFPPFQSAPTSNAGNIWILRLTKSATTVLTPLNNNSYALFRIGDSITTPRISAIRSFSIRPDATVIPGATVRLLMTGACTAAGVSELGAAPGNKGAFYLSLDYNDSTNQFAPVSTASGYIQTGGSATPTITGSAFDRNGNFFLNGTLVATGNSDTAGSSPVFDTTAGGFTNSRLQRGRDIWIRKYSPNSGVLWSSLLGGAAEDITEGLLHTHQVNGRDFGGTTCATDPSGNVYVLGRTQSFDFPRTRGVFGETFLSGRNYITATKISADGSTILYSTNIDNRGDVLAAGIAVDPRGNAYLTGTVKASTRTEGTPGDPWVPTIVDSTFVTNGVEEIPQVNSLRGAFTYPAAPKTGASDAWLTILNPDATALIRSTYIGGLLDEGIFAPYVDNGGDVWTFGWADTVRTYTIFSSTGTRTDVADTGGLAPAFITALAFKQAPDTQTPPGSTITESNAYFLTFNGSPLTFATTNPTGQGIAYQRDGFLLRWRESLPLIASLTMNPASIPGGDPSGLSSPPASTGTITLSAPAPTGGSTISLSLDNGSLASFQPSSSLTTTTVTVAEGTTTANFQVFGRVVTGNQTVNIRADYGGNVRIASLQITPWLRSLVLNPTSVIGGVQSTATVLLNAPAPAAGAIVNLSTSRADLFTFPGGATVTVPSGASQATFVIDTNGVSANDSGSINASLLGVTRTATLGVTPAKLKSVILTPTSVAAGGTSTGKVTLDGKAGAAMIVDLSVQNNPLGYTITPAQVTIPAGATESPNFVIQTPFEAANVSRAILADRKSGSVIIDGPVSGNLSVQAILVSGFIIDPTTIPSGGVTNGSITLSNPAPAGGARVQLNSSRPDLLNPVDANGNLISEVVIPAGASTATVRLQALFALSGDEVATITAWRGPTMSLGRSDNVTVQALTYTLTLNPSEVTDGSSSTGTITISAPAIPGFEMVLASDLAGVTLTPNPVAFTTGSTTATFSIGTPALTETRVATISARAGTLPAATASLTVRALEVKSIKLLPSNQVKQGGTVTIEVTLNRAPAVTTTGKITFSNASLLQLPTGVTSVDFTVTAGQTKGTVILRTRRVPRNLTTTVTATVSSTGNPSISTTLTVVR
ncbi:MAG: SBBP repeat-containing protein [Armatimonadota bacterium]